MEPDLRKWNKPKKYCLALKCFPEILFPSYKVKSVTWISKRYLASEITAQIKSPKLWINLGDPDKMPCSVSGGGQTGSPGLLVVTRTDLDTSPRCHQGSRRWSPGQQTDREFFRLSNRLQDNRKVGILSKVHLRRNNTYFVFQYSSTYSFLDNSFNQNNNMTFTR